LGVLLAGCGGGSSGSGNPPPASQALEGKWTLTTTSKTSQGQLGIFFMNLTSKGNGDYFAAASQALGCYGDGTLTGSQCYGPVDKFMWAQNATTVQAHLNSDNRVTLTSTTDPSGIASCPVVFKYTGTLTAGTMSGTYTNDCFPDSGTWTATKVQSDTGNYNGTLHSGSFTLDMNFSASVKESSTHSLTGTATLTNSTCVTMVTFGPPSMAIGGVTSLVDSANNVYVFALADFPGTNILYIVDKPGCTDIGMGTVSKK
jgi:hypothetical protein